MLFFRNTIRVSNSLDPDQAQHFVGPDLGPNCLQRLSADDTLSWQRVNRVKNKLNEPPHKSIFMRSAMAYMSLRIQIFPAPS